MSHGINTTIIKHHYPTLYGLEHILVSFWWCRWKKLQHMQHPTPFFKSGSVVGDSSCCTFLVGAKTHQNLTLAYFCTGNFETRILFTLRFVAVSSLLILFHDCKLQNHLLLYEFVWRDFVALTSCPMRRKWPAHAFFCKWTLHAEKQRDQCSRQLPFQSVVHQSLLGHCQCLVTSALQLKRAIKNISIDTHAHQATETSEIFPIQTNQNWKQRETCAVHQYTP